MQKIAIGAIAVLCVITVVTVGWGNREGTVTPFQSITSTPKVVLDFIPETNQSLITVRGIEDTIYSNITILINGSGDQVNFTHSHSVKVSSGDYNLSVEVWNREELFIFQADLEIVLLEPEEENEKTEEESVQREFQIRYLDRNEEEVERTVGQGDLPWKIALWKQELEQ